MSAVREAELIEMAGTGVYTCYGLKMLTRLGAEKHVIIGERCERERKADDNMESYSRDGHERSWFEKGGCAGA